MNVSTALTLTSTAAVLIGIVFAAVGAVAMWLIQNFSKKSLLKQAQEQSKNIIQDAQLKAENIEKTAMLESKAQEIQHREAFEKETSEVRNELREMEKLLTKREASVDRKWESVNTRERELGDLSKKLSDKEHDLANKDQQLTATLSEQRSQLLRIANISIDEAKDMLLKRLETEVTREASTLIERMINTAKEEADQKSREIILNSIQRYAAEHTCNSTVSTVDIPSDDMKGRVIGREGRNIRAFEKATGVDVIIDDTPGVVVVSAFDPVRREVARASLEKLIQDGRIHPSRIEEIVEQTNKEMDSKLIEIGKSVTLETNVDNLPGKLMPLLGRLNYRTSYGQNVLKHSVEVAFLCQTMAEELGLDGILARRCGLLHDIGKAADHEAEGTHPQIGADIAKRFHEKPEVINAIAGHHGDIPAISPYLPLVSAADAMSASRPGARRETLERYIKRLEELEAIATGFKGIRQAFAIQAGREIRVIVDPESVDDEGSWNTARNIAKKIEEELTYPGEVKVTLLREVRCTEYAR